MCLLSLYHRACPSLCLRHRRSPGAMQCRFYTECLGMKLLRKRDIPEEKYTNAFLGYGPEDSHFVVELTYSY